MNTIIQIALERVTPSPGAILDAQGVPAHRHDDAKSAGLAAAALDIFREKARPAGILLDVTKEEFAEVFHGEGRNQTDSPVRLIAEASTSSALFAGTVGEPLSVEIARRFRANDFALGSMLDAAASCGAEMAAQMLEDLCRTLLQERGHFRARDAVLRFSPGYCGWHISAQRKLFDLLRPGEIGITLNESFLMQPLKSVTGGILCGPKDVFFFEDTFPFCKECTDRSCRERIRAIMDQ